MRKERKRRVTNRLPVRGLCTWRQLLARTARKREPLPSSPCQSEQWATAEPPHGACGGICMSCCCPGCCCCSCCCLGCCGGAWSICSCGGICPSCGGACPSPPLICCGIEYAIASCPGAAPCCKGGGGERGGADSASGACEAEGCVAGEGEALRAEREPQRTTRSEVAEPRTIGSGCPGMA